MVTRAVAKYVRISPQKARIVANLVKGKQVEDALNLLSFTPKKGAALIKKVVESAIANAQQKGEVDVDTLYINTLKVDEGPKIKRFTPRAMGRATQILKRTSHITILLDEK